MTNRKDSKPAAIPAAGNSFGPLVARGGLYGLLQHQSTHINQPYQSTT
jgi:hypothetical protein